MKDNKFITIPQLAKFLGLSRIAVYNKVKKGEIEAIKIGRNYAIPNKYIDDIIGKKLSAKRKKEIYKAVKKTVEEYGEVLKLLANK